jgi:hypothetical protein
MFYNFLLQKYYIASSFLVDLEIQTLVDTEIICLQLLSDILSTRNLLKRKNLNIGNTYECTLCESGEEETVEHLLFKFSFSASCWLRDHILWPYMEITDLI